MIVVLGYYEGDLALATKLSGWIRELGGCENHQALLVQGAVTDDSKLRSNFEKAFGKVEVIKAPRDTENKWPKSANAVFSCAARHIEYLIKKPWLWLEADCVPLEKGWLDALEAEYIANQKPFMGTKVVVDGVPEHLSGISVYPAILTECAGETLLADDVAFDIVGSKQMLPKSHFTKLIAHSWHRELGAKLKNEKVRFADYRAVVREVFVPHPEAVIYHADKTGSLIDLLRKERKPNVGGLDIGIETPPRTPDEPEPSTLSPKELIDALSKFFVNPLAKGRILKSLKAKPIMKTLLFVLFATTAWADKYIEIPQEQLIYDSVPYENSLFLDYSEPSYILNDNDCRLFRAGEVVRIRTNLEEEVIIMDYKWDGEHWVYRVVPK